MIVIIFPLFSVLNASVFECVLYFVLMLVHGCNCRLGNVIHRMKIVPDSISLLFCPESFVSLKSALKSMGNSAVTGNITFGHGGDGGK